MTSNFLLRTRQTLVLSLILLTAINIDVTEGQKSFVAKLLDKKDQPGGPSSTSLKLVADDAGESSIYE